MTTIGGVELVVSVATANMYWRPQADLVISPMAAI
jgi:hypothetical protein